MNATDTLREDHKQIHRLERLVTRCYTKLYAGFDIPFSDIEKMTMIMSEFLDAIHYSREEDAYFPCVVSYGSLKEEIRAFMIEHEFSRRIAHNIAIHLAKWKIGEDAREPVARFLKAYAVYLDDHMAKEEKFFDAAQANVLSQEEEKTMYEEFHAVTAIMTKLDEMLKSLDYLEQRPWQKTRVPQRLILLWDKTGPRVLQVYIFVPWISWDPTIIIYYNHSMQTIHTIWQISQIFECTLPP